MSKTQPQLADLPQLKRRLANARMRAVYWSGRPSFTDKSYSTSKLRGFKDQDVEYEIAISDITSLADRIFKITGKKPRVTDPREKARQAFARLNEAMTANHVSRKVVTP